MRGRQDLASKPYMEHTNPLMICLELSPGEMVDE